MTHVSCKLIHCRWDTLSGSIICTVNAHESSIFDMKVVRDHVWSTSKCGAVFVWSRSGPYEKMHLVKKLRISGENFGGKLAC